MTQEEARGSSLAPRARLPTTGPVTGLRTWMTEIRGGVTVAKSDAHDLHNIQDIGAAAAIEIRALSRTVRIEDGGYIPEGNSGSTDNIQDRRAAITFRISKATAGTSGRRELYINDGVFGDGDRV